MRKGTAKLLFSRLVLVSLGLIVQLVAIYVTVRWLSDISKWINAVLIVGSWCMALYILSGRSNAAYKMAWIILLMIVPVFGLFLYILLGGNRLSKRLKRKMADTERTLSDNLPQEQSVLDVLEWHDPEAAAQARYLCNVAHCPVYQNTLTEYFSSGEAAYARMLEELQKAQKSIYLEYFIISEGEMWQGIERILLEKVAQGVDVRIIYDDFGCLRKLPPHRFDALEASGAKVCCFNRFVPILNSRLNNRDHRKFMIIDGVIAFTGGVNLADEYINKYDRGVGHWKDSAVLLQGDGVRSMSVMFLSMFNHITNGTEIEPPAAPQFHKEAAGYVQPYTDSPLDYEAIGHTVFMNMILRAKKRVWIMTPYLIIDEAMEDALTIAAKSGLDIRIITPAIGDKSYVHEVTRANYAVLLESGVRIFEYTPGFIHSKVFLADQDFAVVGSVNLDFRSLYLHFEDGVWMYRTNCISQVCDDFEQTLPQCREITADEAHAIRLPRRILRAVLRLFSPLF